MAGKCEKNDQCPCSLCAAGKTAGLLLQAKPEISTALIHWNKLDFSIRFLSISERYLYGKQFMIHVWTLLIFEALKPNVIQVCPNMNKKSFAYFSGKGTCKDCFTLNTCGPQQYLGKLWSLNNNPTGPKCAKKYISNSITPPEA